MTLKQNDDYYCPRCGLSDHQKQTVVDTSLGEIRPIGDFEYYIFNCGICKLKSILGISNT